MMKDSCGTKGKHTGQEGSREIFVTESRTAYLLFLKLHIILLLCAKTGIVMHLVFSDKAAELRTTKKTKNEPSQCLFDQVRG